MEVPIGRWPAGARGCAPTSPARRVQSTARSACCCSRQSSRRTTSATTSSAERTMTKRLVCHVADVPENGLRECEAEGGLRLVVAKAGGEFFGFQAVCPHQDVPLCEGLFDGSVLTCHMHLWQWDIRTGAPLGLAEAPLQRYPLVVEGGSLYLGGDATALDVGELFNGIAAGTIGSLGARARRGRYPAGAPLFLAGRPPGGFLLARVGPRRVSLRPRR